MSGTKRDVRSRRAALRPQWFALARGRTMRWWSTFAMEVKRRGIKHRDMSALRRLVSVIDARLGQAGRKEGAGQ